MIPFRSLWSNTQFAYDNLPFIHPGDSVVCTLPMAHMYGLAFEILNCVNKGCHVHFLTRTPSPKDYRRSICPCETGIDTRRTSYHRENRQVTRYSRNWKSRSSNYC